MTPQGKGEYRFRYRGWPGAEKEAQATFYACPNCSFPSVGLVHDTYTTERLSGTVTVGSADQDVWLPHDPGGKDFPDVPTPIAEAADEAHRCKAIDAHRGALILARAVIEATCKEQTADGRDLNARIDKLFDLGKISADVRDEAHEIRHIGNDMAHGDFGVEASAEDADEMLAFMADILNEVYQRPARVSRRQAERLVRKAARAEE